MLDSGVAGRVADAVVVSRAFALTEEAVLVERPATADRLGHGTDIARILCAGAPHVRLAVAQVFHAALATSPAVVAAGLNWLVGQGVRLISMSFGLRTDRLILKDACVAARETGVILIASAPARGPAVYPGAYDGVIRIAGDARCRRGEISDLWGRQADFGACPLGPDAERLGDPAGGASFAAAHGSAIVATHLADAAEADPEEVVAHLRRIARYYGPERRSRDASSEG